MKKILLLFLFVLFFTALPAAGVVKDLSRQPHLTVTGLPVFMSHASNLGPVLRTFRCTNHTASVLEAEILIKPRFFRSNKAEFTLPVTLPPLATIEIPVPLPSISTLSTDYTFEVSAPHNVQVKRNELSSNLTPSVKGVASPAFSADFFSYLLEEFQKAPFPVKEWGSDSRIFAGVPVIILDSKDEIPPATYEALRLAAAGGSRILVLVLGNDLWPSYAGVEKKGKPFTEKIGFGEWVVVRSNAVDSNPKWKAFVKKKHAAAQKGVWHYEYEKIKWHENNLYRLFENTLKSKMRSLAVSARPLQPPIPMGKLTFLMIAFVIIIGPVNYFVLKRYHAELRAIITIPLLSVLFSAAVIGCVVFGEGIQSRGEGLVETYLDQVKGIYASRGAFGIYAPMSTKGFSFTPDELVYFYEPGKVVGVFNEKNFLYAPSLLRPRVSFSYAVTNAGQRSEKIAVTEKEGLVEIVNGLGVEIQSLFLRNAEGKYFKLKVPLPPGARAELLAIPKLPDTVGAIEKGHYRATVAEALFIKQGFVPDQYKHRQTVIGRWR